MNSQKISIFVAGGTALKQERNVFKSIANDLNGEFESQNIHIMVRSYEHFGTNQQKYNEFIENDADLIIFILEETIGPETDQEFKLAVKIKNKFGKPKIMVFLKEYKEWTGDIRYIQGLLNGTTQEYWTTYKDIDDLMKLGKDMIRSCIQDGDLKVLKDRENVEQSGLSKNTFNISIDDDHHSKNPNKKSKTFKWIFAIVMVALIAETALLLAKFGVFDKKDSFKDNQQVEITEVVPSPVLIVAGGGSAANCIEQTLNYKLDTMSNGYYMHMPSGNAWLLMQEEVITQIVDSARHYYPVCISAEEASDADFTTKVKKEDFLRVGNVVSFFIGYDTLMVFVSNDIATEDMYRSKTITTAELARLMSKHEDANIYATSDKSGTRDRYLGAFKAVNPKSKLLENTRQFSENSPNKWYEPPFLVLGSVYYKPNQLKDVLGLYVVDEEVATKPIYLYCMAYQCKDDADKVQIPQQTLDLLNKLNIDMSKFPNGMIKGEPSIIINGNALSEK